MSSNEHVTQVEQFRQQVYQNFNNRADTMMDLVDALCSNTSAHSVVELSLNPCFRRDYAALFTAIAETKLEKSKKSLAQLAGPYLPPPERRPFWLLAVDATPQARPYARCLTDRGYVYQPNCLKSNKPVTIGHQYSDVVYLPERAEQQAKTWVVPLSTQRIQSAQDKEQVGAEQIRILLEDEQLPFHNHLCAEVTDSAYGKASYLHANRSKANLVSIVRSRATRTFYRQPQPADPGNKVGHPTWFGQAMALKDESTWPAPDETNTTTFTSYRGRKYRVEIAAWHDMLMRGERKPAVIPMHQHPFTLVRVRLFNAQGQLAYQNPLWLIVMGEKRHRLSLIDIFEAYQQRFDVEHFFRFGKQRLLLNAFQTPETQHEETWWQLVHLAYLQLWVARNCAQGLPRPWERSLPALKTTCPSPALVQRDFGRIIRQLGTPAKAPKRRGNSPGRPKGVFPAHREHAPVVYKGKI